MRWREIWRAARSAIDNWLTHFSSPWTAIWPAPRPSRVGKSCRIGEARRQWPLPVSKVEFRYRGSVHCTTVCGRRVYPFPQPSSDLWLAGKAGLIGAAFSIALAIRGRTVALDTELLDNITDGTLRLLIGVIAAGILLLLFASGIVPNLEIGGADFKASAVTWQMVLIIGFVAGFLERLVPDLLDKQNSKGDGAPVQ